MKGRRSSSASIPVQASMVPSGDALLLDPRALFGWFFDAPQTGAFGWVTKRVLDVLLACVTLLLALPILVAAIVLIRLTTRGPAIYRQDRIGYRGRPFTMYKLRTMTVGAHRLEDRLAIDCAGRVFFKPADDPRVTRIGRFLRRTSIDELPQLVNVLLGDMSMVGPRPLLFQDARNFPVSAERLRFAMPPGITGLWQVSGRSRTTDAERLRLDLEYAANWSLLMDCRILLKTMPTVVLGEGAI